MHWMQLKRNLSCCSKWASKLEVCFINATAVSLFLLHLSFAWCLELYFNMKKSYKHIFHSPLHVCYYRKHPNNELRFGRYHLLASNSTFMTDSQYLGTIQIWRNLNEDRYYSTSTKSIICQIDANCFPF